jgi:hypothetical protein
MQLFEEDDSKFSREKGGSFDKGRSILVPKVCRGQLESWARIKTMKV